MQPQPTASTGTTGPSWPPAPKRMFRSWRRHRAARSSDQPRSTGHWAALNAGSSFENLSKNVSKGERSHHCLNGLTGRLMMAAAFPVPVVTLEPTEGPTGFGGFAMAGAAAARPMPTVAAAAAVTASSLAAKRGEVLMIGAFLT